MAKLVSFLLVCLVALASCQNNKKGCCFDGTCSCEPNCWEKCFMNPWSNEPAKKAYIEIYRMATGIRNLYAPCFKPHGTSYMMDATVPASVSGGSAALYQYQRALASIVAMTQPVGDDCNPFCTNKFYRNFAYYVHSWPCKDRCESWRLFNYDKGMIQHQAHQNQPVQPNWLNGGQILSKLCFGRPHLKGHECMNCVKNPLLLAFFNSPFQSVTCPSGFFCAAIGVTPASQAGMENWSSTSPVYHLPNTNIYRYAARRISSCMYTQCCRYTVKNTWWQYGLPKGSIKGRDMSESEWESDTLEEPSEQEEERQASRQEVFGYVDPSGRTGEFKGTLAEFEKKFQNQIGGTAAEEKDKLTAIKA